MDISLTDVLNYAHENHLQFGPEITSTYGPLGWIYFPYYSRHAGMFQLFGQFLVSIAAVSGCCLVAWRLALVWRFAFLGGFTWAASNIFYRADLLVEVSLLCWGLLCLVETGRRLVVAVTVFAIWATLVSLAKVSFLFISVATIAYIAADLLFRQKRTVALGLTIGFVLLFLAGWIALWQNPVHLGSFFLHAFVTIQSYNQALGLEGLASLRRIGFLLTILLLVLVGLRSVTAFDANESHFRTRRVFLFAWLSLFTFVSWKHGFMRLERYHPPLFLGYSFVLAFATDVLPTRATLARCCSRAMAVLCAIILLTLLQWYFFSAIPRSFGQPFREFAYHLTTLLHPFEFNRKLRVFQADVVEEFQLPQCRRLIGRNSVDVFGQYQSYAIDNNLNFKPRPVFQSYNACNRSLMVLNQNYYLSSEPPRFVLFELNATDEKFPTLEDAWLLRHLLINYKSVAEEKSLILLQAQSAQPCKLTLLREGRVELSQRIDVKEFGESPLWLEIEVRPTFLGRLRDLVFASPVVRLAAWGEPIESHDTPGKSASPGDKPIIRRRAPAAMLAAGFLGSPLLMRTSDVSDLYVGKKITRPTAYSVEPAPGQESLWQVNVGYRVYKIENDIPADPKN